MYKGINDKLVNHTAIELGLLELMKNARVFVRQLQLIQKLELSEKEEEILMTVKSRVCKALEGESA